MSRKQWPIIAGGIGVAGAAAIVSVLLLGGDDEAHDGDRRQRAIAEHKAALERDHQRLLAETKIEAARQAAIEAAEQAEAAAREERREREAEEARQRAMEEARKHRVVGILGSDALTQGGAFASLTGAGDITSGFDDKDVYGGLLGDSGDIQGGLGLGLGASGFGPGDGSGSGSGTIGLGTLGHGSGTGQGDGTSGVGMRGRRSLAPTVRTDVTQVIGELDKAIVRRYVRRYQPRVTFCYEKQLQVEPGLAGTVTARFEIGEDGAVTSANASGMNEEVASCVAKAIRTATFARPRSGTVGVTATFRMSPPPAP